MNNITLLCTNIKTILCLHQQQVAEALCFQAVHPCVRLLVVRPLTPISSDTISLYLVERFQ